MGTFVRMMRALVGWMLLLCAWYPMLIFELYSGHTDPAHRSEDLQGAIWSGILFSMLALLIFQAEGGRLHLVAAYVLVGNHYLSALRSRKADR